MSLGSRSRGIDRNGRNLEVAVEYLFSIKPLARNDTDVLLPAIRTHAALVTAEEREAGECHCPERSTGFREVRLDALVSRYGNQEETKRDIIGKNITQDEHTRCHMEGNLIMEQRPRRERWRSRTDLRTYHKPATRRHSRRMHSVDPRGQMVTWAQTSRGSPQISGS